jgi:tripartite-type tricarboxylate transporter receptor subunit TctC
LNKLIAIAFSAVWAASAAAQGSFPSKPITTVVGFEPGGGTDTVGRIVAKFLGENLGQQALVENRAGAGGDIAVDYVTKAAPDGYTIVLANVGSLAVNPHILKTSYNPLKDLTPITMGVVFANVLVVQPSLKIKTLAEYIKLAKEKPGKITYASSGIGGAGHLAGELLAMRAGIEMVHVPAGTAIALATTGSKRTSTMLQDVPTVAEQGFPGYEALNWYAYLGPANMPKDVVERLNREIVKVLKTPAAIELLHKQGVEPEPGTPEELARYMEREYKTWGEVVKKAGIKAH